MKKRAFILVFFFIYTIAFSQKYYTKTGKVTFEASVPSVEEVKAKNNSTTAIINTTNGDFAVLVLVKGFRFKNALMEEHFNENYVDSDNFPKATFKGKINNFDISKLSKNPKKYNFNGILNFHDKKKQFINKKITLAMIDEKIMIKGDFIVSVSDFSIKIPRIVRKKVSNQVNVNYNFELSKKQ